MPCFSYIFAPKTGKTWELCSTYIYRTGSMKSSGYQSASELNSGSTVLVNKVQKRRGRPRSTNRIDLSMVSAALSPGLISSEQIAQSATIIQTPPSVQNSATNNVSAIPRSYMVDVDSMLQTNPLTKRPRKYKKRAPELDPNTGEPIKKPRKKGSGRKSKRINASFCCIVVFIKKHDMRFEKFTL